jgi:hypothetical protein
MARRAHIRAGGVFGAPQQGLRSLLWRRSARRIGQRGERAADMSLAGDKHARLPARLVAGQADETSRGVGQAGPIFEPQRFTHVWMSACDVRSPRSHAIIVSTCSGHHGWVRKTGLVILYCLRLRYQQFDALGALCVRGGCWL